LPAGTVLVEFVRYQHYLGKSKFEPRYGAVVLGQSGDPTWFSLGSAEETETKIRHLQKAVRMRVSDVKIAAVLRALHRQVWTPIAAALPSGTTTVILSPDAQLNFVSFAALLGPDDRFIASDYSLRYVASGRDLLRAPAPPPATPQLIVFANPDFAAK